MRWRSYKNGEEYTVLQEGMKKWSQETALMDGEFDDNHFSVIRDVVARVGVADVRAFGLTLRQAQDRPGTTANTCFGD